MFTSIRDMAPPNSKGKQPETSSAVNIGKRRREEDDGLRTYDTASGAVAVFLKGPPRSALPPPSLKRRLNEPSESLHVVASSSDRTVQATANGNGSVTVPETANDTSSPSLPSSPASRSNGGNDGPASDAPVAASSGAPFNADPFGYLDNRNHNGFSGGRMNFHSTSRTLYGSWAPGPSSAGSSVAITTAPAAMPPIPSRTQAIHAHAYVTFGAGMRQKEIDLYTASHPLKARAVSGGQDTVPYHVPLCVHHASLSVVGHHSDMLSFFSVRLTPSGLLLCFWEGLVS